MTPTEVWADAQTALSLYATDPAGLGGLAIRGRAGPVRDRLLAQIPGRTTRLPATITDEALLGGLDLPATLQAGRPIQAAGLLATIGQATLIAPMAERLPQTLAARLAARMDQGAAFGLVVLDESADPEEQVPAAILDRLAFHIDLDQLSHRDAQAAPPAATSILHAPATIPEELVAALCQTAEALGIASIRAILLATKAAIAAAALAGRPHATEGDAALAARLVLSPRATRLPATQEQPEQSAEPPPSPTEPNQPDPTAETPQTLQDTTELILQAARAAIPANLLASLSTNQPTRPTTAKAGANGQCQKSTTTGRPTGTRPGQPGGGRRLALIETLRAAAPWQRLRAPAQLTPFPLHIRRDDLRIHRTEQRARSTTIFLVDASGSAALNRLAEAKGAVELLLADCYRRRDEVAVIAFRGKSAQLLLPPTRSLVRAKRSLSTLPGGGGTPLALGLEAALALAQTTSRTGATPLIVLLTDGRANVTRAGTAGRAQASTDALHAARLLQAASIAAILIDTSPRPAPEAATLARAMAARYLPLPYADAASLSRAIRPAT